MNTKLTLSIPFLSWAAFMFARGTLRAEHLALPAVVIALAIAADWTRRLLTGLYPFALVGLLYDAMAVVGPRARDARVHLCDLRTLEARLFGYSANGSLHTVHDWLQPRANLALDLYFAIPYGTFIFATIAFAALAFKRSPDTFHRFGWMFLTLNVMGFVTYRLLPAAPPWYFHLRGCDVDVLQRASTGPNLARVDAFLGTPYFASMYARSANVFGALPSLHVTYPLLIVLEGRPVLGPRMRIVSVAYFVSMCVAAVYLDHHWILDVLLGIVFAVIACTVVRAIFAAKRAPSLAVGSS